MEFGQLQLVQCGFFDSRIKFPRVIHTEPRQVTRYELELFTEDQQGIIYFAQEAVPIKKGLLVCAKPGMVRHSKLHFKCLHLHLHTTDPQLVAVLNKIPSNMTVTDLYGLEDAFHRLLSVDTGTFPEQQLLLQSHLYALLYMVVEESKALGAAPLPHRGAMLETQAHIRTHLAEDLSLESLAARVSLSPVYFHKLFCSHTGVTPAQYVLSCRIAGAKALLRTDKLTIGEIAARCGFSSQSYFNYKFKAVTGETPLSYRQARLSRLAL